jgi:hypothetical protein
MNRIKLLVIAMLAFSGGHVFAQVYSNKVVGAKNTELADSIKAKEYPYVLPIWGKKVTEKGFDLPYSAGLSVMYLWQRADLIIDNLQVGFNNGPMYNLDEIVRFNDAEGLASGFNFRPDIWLFPFLNVYGIVAKSQITTIVDFSINIPDSTGASQEVFQTNTEADFDGLTTGFGFTPTVGIGGGWLALDMNMTWTDMDALSKPAFSFVFGPRMGKSFKFKKERSLTAWAGGFRVKIKSDTEGSLALDELFDTQELEAKIDEGIIKVEDAQQQIDSWWSGLSSSEQQNPINKARYETAQRAIDTAGKVLNAADGAVSDISNSTVQYSLDKRQQQMWNFIVGSQYQFNKHLMLRAEFGFLASRTQFIGGLQYRFGL